MTFLYLLSLINFISLINLYLLLDLFVLLIIFINLTSILYPEKDFIYNYYISFFIHLMRKIYHILPYKDIIKYNKENTCFYVESKAFFWIILKMLFVLNSIAFIVISISLLPLFL